MFKISIIIPVYNMEKYLKQCIDSLNLFLYRDIQLILVNDGSLDHSGEICSLYADTYPDQVVYICKKNAGVSAARNEGLRFAKGEFIFFLDADDYVEDEFINKTLEILKTKADLYIFNYKTVDEYGYTIFVSTKSAGIYTLDRTFCNTIYKDLEYQAWNKIFKKELIDQHLLKFSTDMRWSEDLDFWTRYARNVKTISISDEILYNHRINQSGAVSSVDKKVISDIHKAFVTQQRLLTEKAADETAFRNLTEEYVEHIALTIFRCMHKSENSNDIKYELLKSEICKDLQYKPFKLSARYKRFCLKIRFLLGLKIYFSVVRFFDNL